MRDVDACEGRVAYVVAQARFFRAVQLEIREANLGVAACGNVVTVRK